MKHNSNGAGLLLIVVAAITMEATGLVQYFFSRNGIQKEAELRAQSQLETTRVQIMDVVNQGEAAVNNSVWIARWCLNVPDSMHVVARRIVEDNPVVVGSTLALVPGYDRRHPLMAPYACMVGDSVVIKSLATQEYDYPSQEWFTKPVGLGEGYWSEPYIDEGGGEMLMTTYSVPIRDEKGVTAAVLTADISLEWLKQLVNGMQVYDNSYGVIVSREGHVMVGPTEEKDTDVKVQEYSAAVDRTGWSMSVVVPESEIYGDIHRIGLLVTLLQLLGLAMLIIILRAVAKSQLKYKAINEKKERMESELQIGRDIQLSMIPHTFPPFPERKDLDMSACLVPAKEVGGDLFDFYIRDEKLFFCIGDVSGKGVPASLVMAVTRSLFRTVSAHEDSPQRIVTTMNDSMSETNENNMFVTFFLGVLDLGTGLLRYCNAGHNPPMILTDHIWTLDVLPNLALGVMPGMEFQEQETHMSYDDALFLYTDGLTEAENSAHELFGEERAEAVLHMCRSAQGHLEAMEKAVADYVGPAPQSDDLTMLFIHYLNQTHSEMKERSIELLNDVRQIPRMAEFVEAVVAEKKIDNDVAMGIHLAIEEAVTNVMMYAYPEGTEGSVELKAVMTSDRLSFILSDSGKPFDPTAAPDPDVTASAEDRPIGGLGIHLVRRIMDSVQYERKDGKNYLTMTKSI